MVLKSIRTLAVEWDDESRAGLGEARGVAAEAAGI